MSTSEQLIKARPGMLALADELKNIARACRLAGISRSDFYEIKQAYETSGRARPAPDRGHTVGTRIRTCSAGCPSSLGSTSTSPPTSSSWLNLVERWFRELTIKRIRRGVFQSVPDLIAAIDEYVQVHNEQPKPLVWTASAEMILAKVGTCKAILDTLH